MLLLYIVKKTILLLLNIQCDKEPLCVSLDVMLPEIL